MVAPETRLDDGSHPATATTRTTGDYCPCAYVPVPGVVKGLWRREAGLSDVAAGEADFGCHSGRPRY